MRSRACIVIESGARDAVPCLCAWVRNGEYTSAAACSAQTSVHHAAQGDCSVPVQQAGSGRITHARAIVQDHGTLLWFDVDSGVPGSTPGSDASACEARDPPAHACGARYPPAHACGARHPPAPASSAMRGAQTQPEHCAPRSMQPSWVGRATFDPVAFQEHAAALRRKANDWRIWHAQDLRGRRTAEEPHRRAQAEKHGAKRAFDSAFAAASRAE